MYIVRMYFVPLLDGSNRREFLKAGTRCSPGAKGEKKG